MFLLKTAVMVDLWKKFLHLLNNFRNLGLRGSRVFACLVGERKDLIFKTFARAFGTPAVGVQAIDYWQWRSGRYFHHSFRAPGSHFGFCRCWGVAGGEWVPPLPLGCHLVHITYIYDLWRSLHSYNYNLKSVKYNATSICL